MKKIISFIFVLAFVFCFGLSTAATENTAYTYTLSVDNDWIRTQDAYMPASLLLKGYGLNSANDLFIKDGLIYVADTENARIVILNSKTGETKELKTENFKKPSGIFVSEDNTVYVADSDAAAVFIIKDGKEVSKIGKPESNLYAKGSEFRPKNVVVTSLGNIFVCGKDVSEGIMKFDADGTFQGYFAANKNKLTLKERLQDLFYTKTQKQNAVARNAKAIENIDIAPSDLVYSVTNNDATDKETDGTAAVFENGNAVKLHNMAGNNILSNNREMQDEDNFIDIAYADDGRFFAITNTGIINEYDSDGNLIFSFGGASVSMERAGLISNASAIDVDSDGIVYVLDSDKNFIHTFIPTEFTNITHKAISELRSGNYKSSGEIWKSLLRMNDMSRLAHLGYGKTLYHSQKFHEALNEFKIANDREYYSDCFWEIRDNWLHKNMAYIIGAVIIFIIYKISGIGKIIRKHLPQKEKLPGAFTREFKNIFTVLRHPVDKVWELKHGKIGNMYSATMIYLFVAAVYIFDTVYRGFIFKVVDIKKTSPVILIASLVIVAALWIIGSFMIGSIHGGEGPFKKVYIVNAYALLPYAVCTPILVILSYVLTNNEAFIINYGWTAVLIWTACCLFMCNKELQNYKPGEAVKNTLLTVFFMLMAIVAVAMLIILGSQLFDYLKTLFNEVIYRVDS